LAHHMPMLLLSRGQDYQDMHQCSDVTICDLFPKLLLSSRQNPVTKIGIVYDRPSKRATVTYPFQVPLMLTSRSTAYTNPADFEGVP